MSRRLYMVDYGSVLCRLGLGNVEIVSGGYMCDCLEVNQKWAFGRVLSVDWVGIKVLD